MIHDRKFNDSLILFFFFGSGFAALLYQIVWLKYLNLLFGSTIYATAAVLSAFMFGLSLGSRLSVKFGVLFQTPLRSYGLVEVGVGLFAVLFPWIYSHLKLPFAFVFMLAGPERFAYNLCAFMIAFLVLVIPASLMGASLPLLSHYLIQDRSVSAQAGLLYGINTAGAVLGIIVSAFWLIPVLGLSATISFGVIINLVIGLLCFLAGKTPAAIPPVIPVSARTKDPLLYLYAVSGLVALAYEVLWTRILVLHLGSSVYAYAIMLAVFLIGISLGSYVSGRWIDGKDISTAALFGWVQTAWAFSILLQIVQFSQLSNVLYRIGSLFSPLTIGTHFLTLFAGCAQVLLLPTFISGALFPILVTRLWKAGTPVREATSLCYSYNTIGGIFGSFIGGFVLIPLLGTQTALLFLAGANLLLGLAAQTVSGGRASVPAGILAVVLFGTGVFFLHRNVRVIESAGIFQMEGKERLIHLEEDATATISVEERLVNGESYRSLSVNGVNVAGTSSDLTAIQKLQGHVPMILFGCSKPKNVLHIGFGSGGTAYSVSLYPETKITVVELSRAVVRNADAYFRDVNHGIVSSGTLNFIYFDGRSFLQNTNQRFDVILSDSIHPRYSGNGSLYTKDYYELVYAKLNPGGVHSQWIPLYSLALKNVEEILRAFVDVFPETYVWYVNSTVNPYIIVTGRKGGEGISLASMESAFQLDGVRKDLEEIGVRNPYLLLDYFLLGKDSLKRMLQDVSPHMDDRMTVEYESSRILDRQGSWLVNFRRLVQNLEPVHAYLQNTSHPDPAVLHRYFNGTRANLRGQIALLSRKPQQALEDFALARRINPLDPDPMVPFLSGNP